MTVMLDTNAALDHDRAATSQSRPVTPFSVAPYLIVRANPLPATAVTPSGRSELSGLLDELAALDADDESQREALSDLLYAVGGRASREERHELVLPLRRAIHNARPAPIEAPEIAHLVNDPRLDAWFGRAATRERLHAEIVEVHGRQLDRERAHLKRQLDHRDFRRSLVLSGRLLAASARRYQATAPDQPQSRRIRKAEASLVKYVTRAATKTSPMSRYTAVAFGTWGEADDLTAAAGPWRSAVEVNHLLLRRLLDAAARDDSYRRALAYRLVPTLRREDGEVVFELDGDDPERHPNVYGGSDREVRLPLDGGIAAVVKLLSAGEGRSVRYAALVDALHGASSGTPREAIEQFMDRLIVTGLLQPAADLPEQTPDIAARAADVAARLDAPLARELARPLRRLADTVEGWDDLDDEQLEKRVVALDDAWREAYDLVGQPVPPVPAAFEDAVATGLVQFDQRRWSDLLDDCRQTMGVLEAFDEHHVATRLVRSRFVARYGPGGRCRDPREFIPELRAIYEATYAITEGVDDTPPPDDPELADLLALRSRVLDGCLEGIARGDDPVEIDPAHLGEVQARLPRWVVTEPASYTFFLQPEANDGDTRPASATVNKIYGGWGQYASRFLRALGPEALECVRDHLRRAFPADDVVADLTPVFGFNANLHSPLTSAHVDWQATGAPGGIDPTQLELVHDESLDRVVLRLGQEGPRVHVLYLGFLVPYVLPNRLSAMFTFGGSGQIAFDPHGIAERRLDDGARATVRRYPRITSGSLVIARRRWHVPLSEIPRRRPDGTDADHLLELDRWRRQHDLPDRVFVHPPLPAWGESTSEDYYATFFANRKPQYLDLTSPLMLRHLDRLLRDLPGEVVLEEVSPEPERSLLRANDGPHATELLIEVHRGPRRWQA